MGAPLNQTYVQQAIQQECIYSTGDSEGRGGESCNTTDASAQAAYIGYVNDNDFRYECFSWCWGTGCQNIQGSAGIGTSAIVAAAGAAGSVLGVPGVSQIASLIASLINHGAAVHNTENTILCDIVPLVATILGAIVASFRGGAMTAAQANQYMNQALVQTRNALGTEAGRGSGQGLLRTVAVVIAYFDRELPDEEAAEVANLARIAPPSGVSSTSPVATTAALPATGVPIVGSFNWSWIALAGACLLLFFVFL